MLWLNIILLFSQTQSPPGILAGIEIPSEIPQTHQSFEQYGFSSGPDDVTPPYSSAVIRKLKDQVLAYGSTVETAYPLVVQVLQPTHSVRAPISIVISFRFKLAAAQTDGSRIRVNAGYALDNPNDLGLIVHELVHVVQAYRADDPKWLVEGMADYVRYYWFERSTARPVNVARLPATTGYKVTAQFLDWVVRTYDSKLIPQLNKALYEGVYSEEIWKEFTSKSLEELGKEWLASSP
jgi:Peptidase of plants and bacteria